MPRGARPRSRLRCAQGRRHGPQLRTRRAQLPQHLRRQLRNRREREADEEGYGEFPHGQSSSRILTGGLLYPGSGLLVGPEAVRSIAAYLAGDVAAARRVELVLPETGVCSTQRPASVSVATGERCGPNRVSAPVRTPVVTAVCCGPIPR
jgi:hypothetical protein